MNSISYFTILVGAGWPYPALGIVRSIEFRRGDHGTGRPTKPYKFLTPFVFIFTLNFAYAPFSPLHHGRRFW